MIWANFDPKENMELIRTNWTAYVERCKLWQFVCARGPSSEILTDDEGAMYTLISVTSSRIEWSRFRQQSSGNQRDIERHARTGFFWPSDEQHMKIVVESDQRGEGVSDV